MKQIYLDNAAITRVDEKVIFENKEGLKLVGILHLPKEKTNKIIILAHGFTSNKERERYSLIGNALIKKGYAFFRFDFGGSGESYETEITIKNEISDLKSAISFMKEKGYNKIGLLGESLGGLVSIMNYNQKIEAMVLLAPVTKSKDKLKEVLKQEKFREEELKEKGYISKIKDGKKFKIPLEYFNERMQIKPQEILSKIQYLVLIIHGDSDDCIPLEDSKEAIKLLPKGSKLEIISGGDHKLDSKRNEVIPLIVNWFNKNLK